MTERLYYTEPYRKDFTARVVERLTWEDHPAVILDRTAFYPTSGGQPADRGTIENASVLDVVEPEAEGVESQSVIHVLSDPIAASEVSGEIAWERRFDHMQQHTGQHVLSAAFERLLDAATVGFHLGATSSTIDVAVSGLDIDDVLPVEALANRVVWENRPISIHFVDHQALDELPVAEAPPDLEGPIRLVEIAGPRGNPEISFDVNPCGGTHVAHTGEIGLIKVVGVEHRGDDTRIEFLCGGRALRDFEAKRHITATLASMLTVGSWQLEEAVQRLQDENKALQRTERRLRERLLDMESTQLVETAQRRGSYRVVGAVWEGRGPGELRTLARKLADHPDVVALLFSVEERTHFCFARADGLELDANQLLQEACARLEGKGGGRPEVAQGSSPRASLDRVGSVLLTVEASLA